MPKKYVITGAPGSGKGEVIMALENMGENVRHDLYTRIVRAKMSMGIAQPWAMPGFQREIMNRQLEMEELLEQEIPDGRVFLDKGVIDSLVYNMVAGTVDAMCCGSRLMRLVRPYEMAFMMELPEEGKYIPPWAGVESWSHAKEIEQRLMMEYSAAGYGIEDDGLPPSHSRTVVVPKMPAEERARMIIDIVSPCRQSPVPAKARQAVGF